MLFYIKLWTINILIIKKCILINIYNISGECFSQTRKKVYHKVKIIYIYIYIYIL